MAVPYTFANATGNIALSELDANFANVSQNSNRANTAGTVTTAAQPNITSVGTLTTLSVLGNITGGNIISTFYGSGIGLTTIPGANVIGAVPVATTAVSANSATVAGTATTATTAGTVTTAAQPNITSVGTLTSLSVTGNTSSGNILTDNYLYANGAPINLSGTYGNSNVATYLPTYTGNITGGNVLTDNYLYANGTPINLSGTYGNSNVATYLPTYAGNISFGLDGNGLLYTDGVSSVLSSKDSNYGAFLGTGSGNTIVGASQFVGVLMATDFNASNRAITWNNGTLDLDGLGSSILGNIANVNNITASGNITANTFIGSGAGTPTLTSATNLVLSAVTSVQVTGGGTFRLPSLTAGEIANIVAVNGDLIYNTTVNKIQGFENGAWGNLI